VELVLSSATATILIAAHAAAKFTELIEDLIMLMRLRRIHLAIFPILMSPVTCRHTSHVVVVEWVSEERMVDVVQVFCPKGTSWGDGYTPS
jgi:hypothetical protein